MGEIRSLMVVIPARNCGGEAREGGEAEEGRPPLDRRHRQGVFRIIRNAVVCDGGDAGLILFIVY